jgi:hypothetical protein
VRRPRIVLVLLILVAAFVFSSAAMAGDQVEMACGGGIARVQPRSCAPAGSSPESPASTGVMILSGLRWSSWGGPTASGHGYLVGAGGGRGQAVGVVVAGRQSCDGEPFYRTIRLSRGGKVALRLRMFCP